MNAYDRDFSKHAPVNVTPRICEIFDILPIEVKSGTNTSSASLSAFLRKCPDINLAAKLSLLPYRENDKIVNLPLYLATRLPELGA